MEDTRPDSSAALQTMNDELQRSRSPLETVAEEAEGHQPILVTAETEWKSLPLLVEDSNRALLTPSLDLALRYFFAHCAKDVSEISRSDLMMVLIYVIALESGLVPKGGSLPDVCRSKNLHSYRTFDRRLVKYFATRLPMEWLRSRTGPYRMELELVHEQALRDNLCCSVVALFSGDLFIVNLIPSVGWGGSFSCAVPISFHVPSVNTTRLPFSFQYLPALSLKLKNDLFVPFRNLMYFKFIPSINPSLMGVPQELNKTVKSYLDKDSLWNLEKVFKTLEPTCESGLD